MDSDAEDYAVIWPVPILERAMVEPSVILTERELQVLDCIRRGLGNASIANNLKISPKTVEAHLRHIFLKLGARNRTQAVINALERGLF